MTLILAVWLPNWSIQRRLSAKPEREQSPLVVFNHTRRGQCVTACSLVAQRLGVQVGMPIAEVRTIAQKSHLSIIGGRNNSSNTHSFTLASLKADSKTVDSNSLIRLEPDDPSADRAELERLARVCQCFSPIAGIEDADSAETLLLDVSSTMHLFGKRQTAENEKRNERNETVHEVKNGDATALCFASTDLHADLQLAHSFLFQVQTTFQKLHLTAHLGLAETVGGAWAMAHYGMTLRRQASAGSPKPGSAVRSDNICSESLGTRAKILQLPIAALRLPIEVVVLLDRLGFEQIGDLVSLPRGELKARFGNLLLARLDQVLPTFKTLEFKTLNSKPSDKNAFSLSSCGALTSSLELIKAVSEPVEFSVERVLEYPVTDSSTIKLVTDQLIDRLCPLLGKQNQGALELTCRIRIEAENNVETAKRNFPSSDSSTSAFSFHTFSVGLFRPTADARHLKSLFAIHLERLTLKQPVTEVAIFVKRHAPLDLWQQKIFGNPRNAGIGSSDIDDADVDDELHRSREVASLVDRLTSRLGPQAVVQCQLQPDAQPEKAYREVPFWQSRNLRKTQKARRQQQSLASPKLIAERSATKRGKQGQNTSGKSQHLTSSRNGFSFFARPLYLFPTPIELRVSELTPNGLPVFFIWQSQRHDLACWWGPERIETGWWRPRRKSMQIDQRRVVVESGKPQHYEALLGIARDYYRIETISGFRFWIYRCLRSENWFLHGKF